MKKVLSIFLLLTLIPFLSLAQDVDDIINVQYAAKKTGDNTFDVTVTAKIKNGWHIYTQNPGGDGSQIPTELIFKKNSDVHLDGKLKAQGKVVKENVEAVGVINYYVNQVTFTQKVIASKNTLLKGEFNFQTCDDQMCLPPETKEFSIPLKEVVIASTTEGQEKAQEDQPEEKMESVSNTDPETKASEDTTVLASSGGSGEQLGGTTEEGGSGSGTAINEASSRAGSNNANAHSLWSVFLTGLLAGLAAFVTPCIYAMLPITVSFFTKRSKDKKTGMKNALIYSLSIIGIFLVVGFLISALFSETTMYTISTSVGFNLFVFAVFALFGISLLGAFEIALPASWSTKLDSRASTNSFWGIFFMALVLVIVSFSCTSAFISFLIVQIVQAGNRLGGLIGFLGFGTSIALPFALFAFFPGWLNNIAKSGGWLNAVKVSMGFIELAMAMKFLSNVDLQYHWGLLNYNVYLAIWIVIFSLLGFYLLGKIKFSNDDDLPKNMFGQRYLSVTRLFFAMTSLAFVVYMVPGLFGSPLHGISGWLPEKKTLGGNFYDEIVSIKTATANGQFASVTSNSENQTHAPKRYTDFLTSELPGVRTYFDYDEALAASKALGKPVLLDFTGHSCVNCRKMEAAVLSNPEVMSRLNSDFILASLYCDERTELPLEEQYVSAKGKKIKTIGQKNIDIEVNIYGEVGQPIYLFVDSNGEVIKNAGGYVPDVDRFLTIMETVGGSFQKNRAIANK